MRTSTVCSARPPHLSCACFEQTRRAALMSIWHAVFWFVVLVAFAFLVNSWLRLRRAEFIRTYRWPPGLLQKLVEHHPSLSRKDAALVSRGLRQFFIAYLV